MFTRKLNIQLGRTIDGVEARRVAVPVDVGKIIDSVKQDLTFYTKERGGKIIVNPYILMEKHKVGLPTAKKVKYIIEKWLESEHT